MRMIPMMNDDWHFTVKSFSMLIGTKTRTVAGRMNEIKCFSEFFIAESFGFALPDSQGPS